MMVALMLLAAVLAAAARGVGAYDSFASGAADGLAALKKVAAPLCGAVVCVGMVTRSGLAEALAGVVGPALALMGIPKDAAALVLLRPLSGSASLAVVSDMIARLGPDSYAARTACVISSASETVLYTVSLFAAAVGARRTGWAVGTALAVSLAGAVCASLFCRWL